MQRIHFGAADFARTRLRPTVGPLVETAFAAGLLSRSVGAPYARWRSQVAKRLPGWSSPPAHGGGTLDPELLVAHAERYGDDPGAADRHTGLPEVWRAAVAPYWDQLRAYLEAECEARGRIVMAGGVEQLLATLHPRTIWRAPVLEIPGGPDEDVHLDGRGLVLTPSVFLNHRPGRLMAATAENGQAVLAFAAPPDPARAAALWEEPDGRAQSLGALVGQTRAAALRVLRATCTTSQLADRLGISAAGASQHTAVLRETGLITTRRIRNTVLHTVTPLGVALLDGRVVRTLPPQNVVRRRGRPALEAAPGQRRAS
ncbi:winged helix-turn-helix domain-containing protein [Streptomyces sp. TRM76323]|uniref:Winged helix-turn-helix domain-containing protein n=1 Tax=Streptomyces tamarix TaxID=3078565 RepID=A0ABU3QQA9_9ACTN|nr:winged helix-turn-helix domain-containing protein [Streptomyces tamarix]MDT9684961.1 winged helix-turn-helix domain-containing protein [Streptomyces tamarix]